METRSLRQNTKYSDLQIRCDGVTFYAHRLIVCAKSSVLAGECDAQHAEAGVTIIEHTVFDALTLERMLLFIYQGDYGVSASAGLGQQADGDDHTNQANDSASTTALSVKYANNKCDTPPELAPADHVSVYVLAKHYKMSDLQSLALKKLKTSSAHATIHEFLEAIKTYHRNALHPENEMRTGLLFTLVNEHPAWLSDENFKHALSNDTDLHGFSVSVTSAVFEKSAEQTAILKSDIEAQHKTHLQLHSALDQAAQDLDTARGRVTELETQAVSDQRERRKAMVAKSMLEEELKATKEWANKIYHDASTNYKAVSEREELVKKEEKRADELADLVKKKDVLLQQKDKTKSDEKARDALLAQKDKALKQETSRANHERSRADKAEDAIGKKDMQITDINQTVKAERARAEAAYAKFSQALNLINSQKGCRGCGYDFLARLHTKGKKNNGRVVLRCSDCKAEHAV